MTDIGGEQRIVPLFRVSVTPDNFPSVGNATGIMPNADEAGNVYVRLVAQTTGGSFQSINVIDLGADNFDPVGFPNAFGIGAASFMFALDSAGTFDRLRLGPAGDSQAASDFNLFTRGRDEIFNGSTFDRIRSASAANLALQSGLGAALVANPGNWAQQDAPGGNTQATTTRAAVAGQRHVCTSIHASLAGTGVSGLVNVLLRDGASGVGAVLWNGVMIIAAGESRSIDLGGLDILGSVNTAMTLEFDAAGGVNTEEAVSITGYTAA